MGSKAGRRKKLIHERESDWLSREGHGVIQRGDDRLMVGCSNGKTVLACRDLPETR